MPIPETPYTREEAYLNAIATGDSGGIPETPYTREEMYLDYIARNGGGGGGGGSSTLSGLTDVDISNPSDGQTLVYNASAGKWENGAGGGGLLVVQLSNGVCDKTTREMLAAMEVGGVVIKMEHQPGYYALDIVNGMSEWGNDGTRTYEFYTPTGTFASTSLDDYPSTH